MTSKTVEEFRQNVERLSEREARKAFPSELSCYKAMMAREREGAIIADEFRSFKGFLKGLGRRRPSETWTLDRIDPHDPEYGPDKVRWASKRQQSNNRRNTTYLTGKDGKIRSLSDWARQTSTAQSTLRKRVQRGWSDVDVIFGRPKRTASSSLKPPSLLALPAAETNAWPEGVTPHVWQPGYNLWCRAMRDPSNHPSRAEFVALIAGNRVKGLLRTLQHSYPAHFAEGGVHSGDDEIPDSILKSSIYQQFLVFSQLERDALAAIDRTRPSMILDLRAWHKGIDHPSGVAAYLKQRGYRVSKSR